MTAPLPPPPPPYSPVATADGTAAASGVERPAALAELRSRLAAAGALADAEQRAFCDDACLCRCATRVVMVAAQPPPPPPPPTPPHRSYLRARDWNVDKAAALLCGTLAWRAAYRVRAAGRLFPSPPAPA